MKPVLLTDFGSTYTKLTAVDVDTARVLGTAAAYTPSAMPAHPRQADCG